MATRHYKTVSHRVNGVTYRTTQSRSGFWGPYSTGQETPLYIYVICVVLILFLGWPWLITTIPVWARTLIAFAFYGLLIVGYVWLKSQEPQRRNPGTPAPMPAYAPEPELHQDPCDKFGRPKALAELEARKIRVEQELADLKSRIKRSKD
jgi:hypothetical protein